MVPLVPTVTKSPFPYVIPRSCSEIPDVLWVQVTPSDEVRILPEKPTVTKVPLTYVTPNKMLDVPMFLKSKWNHPMRSG